jgi:hypothetical protein
VRLGRKAPDIIHGKDQRLVDQAVEHQPMLARIDGGNPGVMAFIEQSVRHDDPVEILQRRPPGSGRGKIGRVDVSVDDGKSWQEAQLQEPVLTRALTRFRLPWHWDGQSAVIQSRAIDQTGYVQPTLAELLAVRGEKLFLPQQCDLALADLSGP